MLTEAIIQTSTPTSLKLDDVDPDEILVLKSISNLSSVKVTQFMGDFAKEGSYYQGRRAEKRNPVINLKLNPNYTENISVSAIRELLYRMFMEPQRDSDGVQVLLKDDEKPDRYFIGYTETFDTDAWVKDQSCAVSMITTDAYLRSADLTEATNTNGWFTLPFIYEGSADTGLVVTIKMIGFSDIVTLQNDTDIMTFEGTFVPGDILEVSTIQGQRSIKLNGVDRMSLLTSGPNWLQLKQQGNVLKSYGEASGDGKAVITSYSYRAAWWGI
jgi:hypothetical protein